MVPEKMRMNAACQTEPSQACVAPSNGIETA
jgi:hypothetical protein